MLSAHELEKGISVLKIIWTALTMSLIMYVFAVPVLLGEASAVIPDEAYANLRLVMYGAAFATLVASWYLRRFILARKPATTPNRSRQHPGLQRYTTAMIVALAMSEAIGLYGLVLYLLGNNQTDLYSLTLLSAAAMTLYFPRKDDVIQLAEKFDRSA